MEVNSQADPRDGIMSTIPRDPIELTKMIGRKPNINTALNIITWEIGDMARMAVNIRDCKDEVDTRLAVTEIKNAIASSLFQASVISRLLNTCVSTLSQEHSSNEIVKIILKDNISWTDMILSITGSFTPIVKEYTYASWHPTKKDHHIYLVKVGLGSFISHLSAASTFSGSSLDILTELGIEIMRDRVCDRLLRLGRFKYYEGERK